MADRPTPLSWLLAIGRALVAGWAIVFALNAVSAVRAERGPLAWAIAAFLVFGVAFWTAFWLWIIGRGRTYATVVGLVVWVAVGPALGAVSTPRGQVDAGDILAVPMIVAGAAFGWRVALPVIAGLAVLTVGVDAAGGDPPETILLQVGAYGPVGLLAIAGRLIVQAAVALEAARSEIARRAVADERLRLARDLHDVLGHRLALIALRADMLAETLTARTVESHRQRLRELHAAATAAIAEVGDALSGHRGPGLGEELWQAGEALRSVGIEPVIVDASGAVPEPVARVLSLSLREAVTNVIRHSGGRTCWITVGSIPHGYRLEVRDDGRGAAGMSANGGLSGIRDRSRALGGELVIGPLPPGFRLQVRIPRRAAR